MHDSICCRNTCSNSKCTVNVCNTALYIYRSLYILVSHKFFRFCEKFCLLPAAQFTYRKGLGCTEALLTISHHLQKFSDTGMESYIVQLEFRAPFDRVSHVCLLFKLKSIGVGGRVLSICWEFVYNRRQRVVVDGVTSE